jgi:uncharacterized protein (DUF2062 family)
VRERSPGFLGWLVRWRERTVELWRRALHENASPARFASAFAIGAFVSASPLPPVLFLRTGASIGLAWALRVNRLTAFLGSHTCFGPLWFVAIGVEVRVGCALLGRPLPVLPTLDGELVASAATLGRQALGPCLVGGAIVAPLAGATMGALVYPVARWWHARRAEGRG